MDAPSADVLPARSRHEVRAHAEDWLTEVRGQADQALAQALTIADEAGRDRRWQNARQEAFTYALRPGKRFRAALLTTAYALGRGERRVPHGIWQFAAGVELLHLFMLVHDDIADRADVRRGGAALHRLLGSDDLGVVMGDYFFARAIEVMLAADVAPAARVVGDYLGICRETAAGQYLDIDLGDAPLASITLFQTLKIAQLKTARYGFVAPLVAGAELAGAPREHIERFARIGRHLGLAYQMADDLIGLFGDASVAGKPTDADFTAGKRTYPVIAAYLRAPEDTRRAMERLWERRDPADVPTARALIERYGGRAAAERLIAHSQRAALQLIAQLPNVDGCRCLLEHLVASLGVRAS